MPFLENVSSSTLPSLPLRIIKLHNQQTFFGLNPCAVPAVLYLNRSTSSWGWALCLSSAEKQTYNGIKGTKNVFGAMPVGEKWGRKGWERCEMVMQVWHKAMRREREQTRWSCSLRTGQRGHSGILKPTSAIKVWVHVSLEQPCFGVPAALGLCWGQAACGKHSPGPLVNSAPLQGTFSWTPQS